MSFGRLFLSLAIVISIAFCALGMPNVINYQGKLTDNTGAGINDSLEMSFRLFNDPLVGAPLWTELHTGANKVFVHKGLFDVALGSITPITLPFDATYYLEITVDGSILAPRVLLTTSPYAYRAAIADSVVGGSIGDSCLWADHSTDPLIFAKNNDDVIVRDDGDNMGDIYVNMDHSAFNSAGIYVNRDGFNHGRNVSNIYAYRTGTSGIDNGGTSWDYVDVDAAIKGYTLWGNKFTAAVAGYNWLDYDTSAAVIGAYYDGDIFGALGYSCDGNMYSGYFYGEAVHFHPMSRPFSPVLGDIYTDETTLKMYFYNGVDWVDMTATPGAGASLWTDHATDPYIYANNNANVQVSDATVDTFLTVINHGGTAIKAVGMDYPEPQYGYLGYGGTCPGHPEGWDAAGVMGHTSSYVDAIYGYAEYGGYGVLGVSGYDDDDYGGVGGYNSESGFWGRLGTYYYGGEFTEGIRIQPKDAPPAANEGAIYANSGDKNLYYYDGTSWVDLTAGGGGGVGGSGTLNNIPLWTPDGATLGNSRLAQDSYQIILSPSVSGSMQSNLLVYCDETSDKNAIFGGNLYGSDTPGTAWYHANFGAGVYGLNEINAPYHAGIVGSNWSDYGDHTAGVVGSNNNGVVYGALFYDLGGAQYAGYFNGDVRVTGRYFDTSGDAGTSGQILSSTGAGTNWINAPTGGGVSGSGTVNYLPLWTPTGTALGTSKLRDEGTYTLIHGAGMTPAKPGNFSVAADDATDYFGLWASNFNGRTTAGTGWAHDGVGGGGIYADNSTDSKYYAGLFAFNWSNAETTTAVVGADYYSSNFGALAYRADSKTHAGYFNGLTTVTGSYPDPMGSWVGDCEGILNVVNTNTTDRSYGIQSRIPYDAGDFSGAVVGSMRDPSTGDGVMAALGYNNHLSQKTALWAYDDMSAPSTSYALWAYSGNSSGYAAYFDGNFHLVPRSSSLAEFGNIYASTVDNKLYFHNGTAWVDLTASGGGSSLWTDAGTYISANNNTATRVYDEGQTYGLYYSGANKYGVYGQTSNTIAGASGVFGYANSSTAGSGFGPSYSIAGVKGHSLYGNAYHFGVHGDTYSNDAGSPTAGVIGTFTNDGTIWGALAYKHTDASVWAGYFNGNVHITGDLTIDGDYLHDHWGQSWTGSGSQGLRLSNTSASTSQIDLASDVNGITLTHYNSGDYGAAISAMEGNGTSTYSHAKLAWYSDGTLPTNPVNVAVYGLIPPVVGGGGFAIYGENTRTAANQYAGYFNGKVKVDGRVETSQNPYCITLTAGEAIAVGEIVMVSTTTDLQVVRATTGSETVIGVAVTAATTGNPVTIAIGGAVQVLCNAAVTRGNFVRCGVTGQAINSGTTGQAGDFGIFLQSTPGAGLAWMVFKQAEIY